MRGSMWGCALCSGLMVLGKPAFAQSAESKAAAEALFDEGRRLLDAGQINEACKKLEQSDKLDPAVGTQLNLATCYERAGRTASAWATYRRAAALAQARRQSEREQLARDGAAALEAKLCKLSIVVPAEARIEGLAILKNGERVAPGVWGQPIPVDPGTVRIEATAPGRTPWWSDVEVREPGMTSSVSVPELVASAEKTTAPAVSPPEHAPSSGPIGAPAEDDPDAGSSQRTWAFVVGGAGVAGLAVGGFFALRAASKNDESKDHCLPDDENLCTPEGAALRDDAQSAGTIATVAGGLGLALAATGVVLYLTAPSNAPRIGFRSTPGGAALVLGGQFR